MGYSGGQGDVIAIDLRRDRGGTTFELVDLANWTAHARVFTSSASGTETFASTGRLYVAPHTSYTGTITGRVKIDGQEQIVAVHVREGISTRGDHAVRPGNTDLDILRLQQRLRYFGYRGADGELPDLTRQWDDNTLWAVGLFNAAMTGGTVVPSAVVRRDFINSPDTPKWIELDPATINLAIDGLYISPNVSDGSPQTERFASEVVEWLLDASVGQPIRELGDTGEDDFLVAQQERLELRKASRAQGGPPSGSEQGGDHQAGLHLDIETAASNSSEIPFFAVDERDGQRFVLGNNGNWIYRIGGQYVEAAPDAHPRTMAVQVEIADDLAGPLSAWNNRPVLLAIRDYLQDDAKMGYDLTRVRTQLEALLTSGVNMEHGPYFVASIYHNDPRTWTTGLPNEQGEITWTGDGQSGRVRFAAGANGVFQVNLATPVDEQPHALSSGAADRLVSLLGLLRNELASLANVAEFGAPLPLIHESLGSLLPLGTILQLGLVAPCKTTSPRTRRRRPKA